MSSRALKPFRSATVIAMALAAILPMPSAQAQNADPVGATNQVFTMMNAERAKKNVPALVRQCDLDAAATRHVNDMVAKNFLNHKGSDNSMPWDRAAAVKYPDAYIGENIFGGTVPTAEAAMAFWMGSDGHRGNILNANYKEVGVAYAFGPNTSYKNYWCVVFGGGGGRQCVTVTPPTVVQATSRPLGGVSSSNSAALYDSSAQRLYAFVRGTDGGIWYRARRGGATSWEEWKSLGGGLKGNPAAGSLVDRAPAVFARGADDAIWYRVRTGLGVNAATGAMEDTFSNWVSLGAVVTSDPVVTSNSDGHPEIFVRGTDNALYHNWQLANGTWAGWYTLSGGLPGTPAVGINQDGRLAVFHRGTDNGLWIRTQLGAATSSSWGGWNLIGPGLASDPVVTQLANGRMAVCYRKTDNTVAARWQYGPNHTGWTDEALLGSPNGGAAGNPSVVVTANGQLQVFVRSSGGVIHRRVSLTAEPNNGWGGWSTLQFTATQDPVAFRQPSDGSASLFAIDGARALWELLPARP